MASGTMFENNHFFLFWNITSEESVSINLKHFALLHIKMKEVSDYVLCTIYLIALLKYRKKKHQYVATEDDSYSAHSLWLKISSF